MDAALSDKPEQSSSTLFRAGFAKVDITAFEPRMAMLGWGNRRNQIRGVAHPLHARAAVIESPSGGGREAPAKVAYLCAELLLISQGLRQTVIDRLLARPELGLGDHNLILTANHTHSGPSGYSHHFWINLAAPGFSQRVYDHLADRFVEAIVSADRSRVPARLRVAQREVPLADGIAFNRSWQAYSRNPEVEPITKDRRDEVTDRTLTVLRADTVEGEPLGVLTWLAVHCTSVHSDNDLLHPDNKGLAAAKLEAELGGSEGSFVAVFAQEAAGDVSPNYRYDPTRRLVIGRCDDDFESADYVGAVQARVAREAFAAAADEPPLESRLDYVTTYVDFACAPAKPAYTPDSRAHHTRTACVGLSMVQGTAEGPGPLLRHRWVQLLSAWRRRFGKLSQAVPKRLSDSLGLGGSNGGIDPGGIDPGGIDPKVPFLDVGAGTDGRLLGLFSLRHFRLPAFDPAFAWVKSTIRSGALPPGPWIPQVVPLQLVRFGSFALAAFPFEMTTMAGRRLRQQLSDQLASRGVGTVVVNPYSNAYVGYVTTFEEYQAQAYEGGYTLFGPHTLAAVRTGYEDVVERLGEQTQHGWGEPGPRVPIEAVARVPFDAPWPDTPYPPRR